MKTIFILLFLLIEKPCISAEPFVSLESPNFKDMTKIRKDYSGQVYGRLTILSYCKKQDNSHDILMNCICSCGKKTISRLYGIRSGHCLSCGCLHIETATKKCFKHGLSETPEYSVWRAMNQRCRNKNAKHYANYGGRGITVCEEWKNFETFLSDMGKRPSKNHTIERVNNSLGYSKQNCKWATMKEQMNNTRLTTFITWNGKTKSLSEWCEIRGVKKFLIRNRLASGWSIEKAFTAPKFTRT